MANPTASIVRYSPPKGGSTGTLVVDALWATYAQNADKLSLANLAGDLPLFDPTDIISGDGYVGSGTYCAFDRNATPTMSDLGTLRVYAANGTQQTAGAYTGTARLTFTLSKPRLF